MRKSTLMAEAFLQPHESSTDRRPRKRDWIPALLVMAAFLAIVLNMAWVAARDGDRQPTSHATEPADMQAVETGKSLYSSNCAPCHGAQGEGAPGWRQPNPDGSHPPPPHDDTGHTWHHGDGYLLRIIRDGANVRAVPNSPPVRAYMPAFGGTLDTEQIKAVIAYIKSLWTEERREAQAEINKNDPFPPS